MKHIPVILFACVTLGTACFPSVAAADPATVAPVKIKLNDEPSHKSGAPQTVRTKLFDFKLDGYTSSAFAYRFGDKEAGVEIVITKNYRIPENFPHTTDSHRFSAQAILASGLTNQASFSPQPSVDNAMTVYERHVAKFGSKIRLTDINQIIVIVDGKTNRFAIDR